MIVMKSTLMALKHNVIINSLAIVLLSLLFYSELSLYHYYYYSYTVVKERQNTDFSKSMYTFELSKEVSFGELDDLLDGMPSELRNYEDIVIRKPLMSDDESNTDIICFYNGMSPLHSFKSSISAEIITNEILESQEVLASNDINLSNKMRIGNETYRVIQGIPGLSTYIFNPSGNKPTVVLCGSNDTFSAYSNGTDIICIEYKSPLVPSMVNRLQSYFYNKVDVKSFVEPIDEITDSVDTIRNITFEIVEIILAMFIITTCVLPIIRYCLWKRYYEFSAYRMCGASHSYVQACKLMHTFILGTGAVIIGILLSWKSLQTRGFWLVLLLCIFIFYFRILLEVIIDNKSSTNQMEENKVWRS